MARIGFVGHSGAVTEEAAEFIDRLGPGMLLVATPHLDDPNFARSVVLLMDHGVDGSIGVIINRPTDVAVEARLAGWEGFCRPPGVLFRGGPVSSEAVMGLVEISAAPPHEWVPVFANVGPIDLSIDPTPLQGVVATLRVFSGYAGWGPAQLVAEVSEGSWWVIDPHPDDPFAIEPDSLWARVLGRQRGELSWFSRYPVDPDLN